MAGVAFHSFYGAANDHAGLARNHDIHADDLRVGDRVSPFDHPGLTATARPVAASVAAFGAS